MRLRKLDRVLSAEGDLQPVLAKARDLRALAGLVQGFFPADLARQVRVANYRDGEVVLVAANPAAGAKLRLLAPTLSRFLSERRWQVNSVSIRVQPNSARQEVVAPQKTAHLSTPTLDSLRALHDRMGSSPARDALGRLLARRGRR
ncbi:MAG: DciA family protein [Betaproteobacteria bacterium]